MQLRVSGPSAAPGRAARVPTKRRSPRVPIERPPEAAGSAQHPGGTPVAGSPRLDGAGIDPGGNRCGYSAIARPASTRSSTPVCPAHPPTRSVAGPAEAGLRAAASRLTKQLRSVTLRNPRPGCERRAPPRRRAPARIVAEHRSSPSLMRPRRANGRERGSKPAEPPAAALRLRPPPAGRSRHPAARAALRRARTSRPAPRVRSCGHRPPAGALRAGGCGRGSSG
jgi:hypothetical protein